MSLKFIGKKVGMTQFFDKNGNIVPCTVILAAPNIITQIKVKEKDGVNAVQLGAFPVLEKDQKRVAKPQRGHFAKAKAPNCRFLAESKVDDVQAFQLGQEVTLGYFQGTEFLDVSGTSKGKGYQGVMKLHGMAGGPAAHGSGFHRHAGSTGMRTSPGRCFPGGKRASQMGREAVTIQNLMVVSIDETNSLLLVKGAVPGAKGGVVYFTKAAKKGK